MTKSYLYLPIFLFSDGLLQKGRLKTAGDYLSSRFNCLAAYLLPASAARR